MKWNRAERWTDPSRLHSLLLAVFFFLGIGAGVVCAGRISGDVERELTTYLTDYLALAQSQDLGISVVCSLTLLYLQGPALAFLCGVCSAGILLLPLLAAAAGFFPAYAAGCLTASFGGRGLLLALAFGLVSAAVTAFAVHPPVWVWLALAAWCAGWCLFGRLPRRVQRLGLLAGSLVYLVGLFLCQRSFLAGARQFGAAVAASLNQRFNANLAAAADGTPAQLGLFLALAALPLAGLLALAALRRADILLLNLLLLPAAVFLLLAGSNVSTPCWLLLAVGWLGALAGSRAVRRRALWGAAACSCAGSRTWP